MGTEEAVKYLEEGIAKNERRLAENPDDERAERSIERMKESLERVKEGKASMFCGSDTPEDAAKEKEYLSELCSAADTEKRFSNHYAFILSLSRLRTAYACTFGDTVTVYVPGIYRIAGEEVLMELMSDAIRRSSGIDVPPFGEKTVEFMRSPEYRNFERFKYADIFGKGLRRLDGIGRKISSECFPCDEEVGRIAFYSRKMPKGLPYSVSFMSWSVTIDSDILENVSQDMLDYIILRAVCELKSTDPSATTDAGIENKIESMREMLDVKMPGWEEAESKCIAEGCRFKTPISSDSGA